MRGIRAAHDFDARARRVRQLIGIERFGATEVLADPMGNGFLSVRRSIGKLRAQRGPRACIDPQRRRALREMREEVLTDLIQHFQRIRFSVLGSGRRRWSWFVSASLQQRQGGSRSKSRHGFAAVNQRRHANLVKDDYFTKRIRFPGDVRAHDDGIKRALAEVQRPDP